jgi:hypothetical protein
MEYDDKERVGRWGYIYSTANSPDTGQNTFMQVADETTYMCVHGQPTREREGEGERGRKP